MSTSPKPQMDHKLLEDRIHASSMDEWFSIIFCDCFPVMGGHPDDDEVDPQEVVSSLLRPIDLAVQEAARRALS